MALDLCCKILVVGGGPAGSACALRLAQLGHDVCLLERRAFPRSHIGESLSGGVRAQLEFLGVAGAVENAGLLRFDHALVNWSGEAFERRPMDPNSFTVDRACFDEVLLDAAQKAGVRVVQPAIARAAERCGPGWHINVEANGEARPIQAKFIIDASGRTGLLRQRRIETSPRTLALYGYWRGARLPQAPRIEAGASHWFWGSPVPGRGFNAMVFVDRASRRKGHASLRQHYHRLIEASQLLAEADTARLDDGVFGCDTTSFEDSQCFGDGFLKVGEAAFAIDPLSSSGVQAAIQSALTASVVAHTILSQPDSVDVAQFFYAQHVKTAASRHATWAARYYGEHRRYAADTFWQQRAGKVQAATAAPVGAEPVRQDWRSSDYVVLSRDVRIEDAPSVVGDFVVLRPAVSHPTLARPIAFVGGVDLPTLLNQISPVSKISDLEKAISLVLPPNNIPAVLDWLLDQGLLERSQVPKEVTYAPSARGAAS